MGERQVFPHWPRRMKAPMAAAYLSVSETKFDEMVRKGVYPAGKKDGGNVFWDKVVLDQWVDAWSGLTTDNPRLKPW